MEGKNGKKKEGEAQNPHPDARSKLLFGI